MAEDRPLRSTSTLQSNLRPCAVAIILVAIAVSLRFWLNPWLGERAVFLPFLIAALGAAWYGGLWPGLLAVALGVALAPSVTATSWDSITLAINLVAFSIAGIMAVVVCEALQRARLRAERLAAEATRKQQELESEVQRRERMEQSLHQRQCDLDRQNRQLQILYRLGDAANRATSVPHMCDLAMQALQDCVGGDRAAVLLFENDGVMRFKAWHGLSDHYRAAVEGHSPWKRDDVNAAPIAIDDVLADESLAPLRATITGEGIGALAFIPVMGGGALLGKFMIYFNQPHHFTADELTIAKVIANKIGYAINRSRSDTALRDSEKRLSYALEATTEGVWDWNVQTGEVYFSHRWIESLGFSPQEVPPHVSFWESLVHPDDLQRVREVLQAHLEGKTPVYVCENRLRTKTGHYRWNLDRGMVVERDAEGRPLRMVGTDSDISERKKVEEAIRENEERLRLATSAGKVGVWEWDIVADRVTWSDPLYLIHGVEPGAFGATVQAFREIVHPDDRERVESALQTALAHDAPYELEFRALRPDGEVRWIYAQATVLRDAAGCPSRLLGASLDITEQKRTEEELHRHRHRLEELVRDRTSELEETHSRLRLAERMAAIGTLSAGLGHDMGNLLLPLRARLEAMERAELSAELREHVVAIGSCAEYLQKLAQGLRQFALDASDWDAKETTELCEWQRQVEPFYRSAVPRGVQLQWKLPAEGVRVAVARHALTQAMYNLVQNAGEALRGRQHGRVVISAEACANDWMRLMVSDNGPGMSPQTRARCLEPFYTTKTRGLSTGMGLSLVHGVVCRAGGTIEVQSQPNKGTTFILTLRRAGKVEARRQRPMALVKIASARVQSFLNQALLSLGFEIAIDDAAVRSPAVLVVDTSGNGATPHAVRVFVDAEQGRQALIIGGDPAEYASLDGRVRVVTADAKPSRIVQELQALAQQSAALQHA